MHVDRFADPLHLRPPEWPEREIALDQMSRAVANDRGTGIGEALQPGCKIYGVTNRRVFGMASTGFDRSHHHFAAICSGPDLNWRPAIRSQTGAVAPDLILHPHRTVQTPLRMIFAGHGGAEQREDAIARRLHDVAVIAPHGVDHQPKYRVNDRARFFGVEVLPELGRIHNVDEQGRNHFAFPLWNRLRFDGRAESEAEVRGLRLNGRVGGRALGWRLPAKRHTTFIAEFRARSIGCPASGTMQRQGCAAGVAEFRDLRILTIAAWTLHALSPRRYCNSS